MKCTQTTSYFSKMYTYIFFRFGSFLNIPAASRTTISLSFNLLQKETKERWHFFLLFFYETNCLGSNISKWGTNDHREVKWPVVTVCCVVWCSTKTTGKIKRREKRNKSFLCGHQYPHCPKPRENSLKDRKLNIYFIEVICTKGYC